MTETQPAATDFIVTKEYQLEPVLYDPFERLDRPAELVTWRAVVYTPPVLATPKRLERDITSLCALLSDCIQQLLDPEWNYTLPKPKHTEFLLTDDADRLKFPALEQVRDLYDRMGTGVVLIGMPGLEKLLSPYPQLYSRVGFVHQYRALSSIELQFILQRKWKKLGLTLSPDRFDDVEVMAAIARITNGNFRLVQRLFSQIHGIMEVNDLTQVTDDVVLAARETLVIGPT